MYKIGGGSNEAPQQTKSLVDRATMLLTHSTNVHKLNNNYYGDCVEDVDKKIETIRVQ